MKKYRESYKMSDLCFQTPLVRSLFQYGLLHLGLGHVLGSFSERGYHSYSHLRHFCFSIGIAYPIITIQKTPPINHALNILDASS